MGFALIETMIVVLIAGILLAIAVPNFKKARATSRKQTCLGSLERLESGKELWAQQNHRMAGDACSWSDVVPTYVEARPECPSGGVYTIAVVGTKPSCSKAAALDHRLD